jgi:hypothetical protein
MPPLTIALHGGLYLSIIMDGYGGPHTHLTIALHGIIYLAIIMDRYEGPLIALTIAFEWRPLLRHYNGTL